MNKLLRFSVLGAFLLLLGLGTLNAQEVVFTSGPDVTPANVAGGNGGFAWADVNGDGTQDVFICPNNILLNHLTYFTPVSTANTANLSNSPDSDGGLLADLNGDGVPDLWSTNNSHPESGLFYDSSGVYLLATGTGELSSARPTGMVFCGIAVGDIDHSNYLSAAWQGFKQASWSDGYVFKPGEGIEFLKGGASGFTRVGIGASGTPAIDTSRAFESWDVHFFDANNDGYQDLLMPSFRHGFNKWNIQVDSIGARKGSILYLNDGTGNFVLPSGSFYTLDSVSAAGVHYGQAVADTGIVVDDTVKHFDAIGSEYGDLNNDGNVDLILTGLGGGNYDGFGIAQGIVVLYGKGDGTFTYKWDGANVVVSGLPTSGSIRSWDIGDYNNDGIPDVLGSQTYGGLRLFRGNGNGTYTETTDQDYAVTGGAGSRRAAAFIDYNNDGFLDIYRNAASTLLTNGGNSNHWIAFTPVGTGHNMSAVGAKFTLYTQGGTFQQTRYVRAEGGAGGCGDMRALFGIGINTSIDSVAVVWPDGTTQSFQGLAVDKYWTVIEGSAVPGTVALVAPADAATGVAQADTMTWDPATGAVQYKVQVSLDPTFANTAMMAVDATVSDTSYVFSLGAATQYYWRVAAMNGGFMSDYTAANTFTTAGSAAAEVPVIISPANKVLQNSVHNYNAAPVLKFALPSGMTLADYGHFTFKGYFAQGDVAYKHIVVEAYSSLPTGHFLEDANAKIGDYNRALGGSTGWEDITISIPNSKSFTDTVYIAFGIHCAGTGDVGGSGVPTIWYADNVALVDTTVTPNVGISEDFEAMSLGDPLAHIGWNASDIQSVVASDPVSTGVTLQPAKLTLAVNKTADASRYQWQVSTLPTFATFYINDSTANTTYAGQFTGGQTFYLRVRGMNDLGASAFSAVDTFTIVSPPARTTLLYPVNNAQNVTSDSVSFVWRKVSDATSYNLQVSTVGVTKTYSGITDTSYMVKNLSKLTNYTWKVEAVNAGGTSYYTGSFAFTTIVAAPAVPNALEPVANAADVYRVGNFVWNSSLNATMYRLQVSTDNAFATIVVDTTVKIDTTCVLATPLDATTDYYWRLDAENLGGASAFSTARLFTTGTEIVNSAEEVPGLVPREFALFQNYPNPFNPTTTVRYDIPMQAHVKIVVYDMLGRSVAELVDAVQAPNRYAVEWSPSGLGSGVYFLRIVAKSQDGSLDFTSTKKLLFLK